MVSRLMGRPSFNPTTAAFSVERFRGEMLTRLAVPDDLLQAAINKIHAQLDAKETKFFVYRGEVIEKVEVVDHATQAGAADKILSMAGLYARERDGKPPTPSVAIEVDPITGIVRMVIGSGDTPPLAVRGVIDHPATNGGASLHFVEPTEVADEPEVVKVKQGALPASVHAILFGEDDV